ncbi:MAG: O-antigen ligase family protein [Bryobacteraceae bacterium]
MRGSDVDFDPYVILITMGRFNNLSADSPAIKTALSVSPRVPPEPHSPTAARVVLQNYNPLQRAGFFLLLLYTFSLVSLVNEVTINAFGFKPYATIIVGPLALLCAFASGDILRALNSRIGLLLVAFSLWMLATVPFSVWRTGSLELLGDYFLKSLPIFFMTAALTVRLRDCRRFINTLGVGAIVILVVAFRFSTVTQGRLAISFGSFANPNDLSTHLIVLLPFVFFMGFAGRSAVLARPLIALALAGLVYTVLRTGSRSGFIGLLAVAVMLVLKATPTQRIVLLLLFVIGSLAAVSILRGVVVERFATLFSSSSDTGDLTSTQRLGTIGSNEGRIYLLKRSVQMTIAHPIFGVGPGQFAVAENDRAKEHGKRGLWLGTHNSYTQVSSETGIPGLILFASVLLCSLHVCNSIYRKARRDPRFSEIANMAFTILASLVGFSVNIFFSHIAYSYYLPMLAGLTVAFALAARKEMSEAA